MRVCAARNLIILAAAGVALASCGTTSFHQEVHQAAMDAVAMMRENRNWAWALGIALIWADLLLPVPQTAVIAALGIVYGTAFGGLVGSVGLVTGGLLGYLLMRTALRGVVKRLVGARSLDKMQSVFDGGGAWAIVLTRSLPYSIPEAVVLLAGIAGMPMAKFLTALTIGSVPIAFMFAAIGDGWSDDPALALVVSFVLPIALLPLALYLLRRRRRHAA
jgi:uncharacterized membrane protein YdjX (TVP38/TMEM64 family)